MMLMGDRNWVPNTANPTTGYPQGQWLSNSIPATAGWTDGQHQKNGNLALSDGSVQQVSTSKMKDAIRNTGDNNNYLAFPGNL
jgi:hypothetical protein